MHCVISAGTKDAESVAVLREKSTKCRQPLYKTGHYFFTWLKTGLSLNKWMKIIYSRSKEYSANDYDGEIDTKI